MSTISASTTSTTAFKITTDTTGALVFQTGSSPTTALTLDTSQNMGLGVTPSASSNLTNIEMPQGVQIGARKLAGYPQMYLSSNVSGDAYGPTYKINGYATQYRLESSAGKHEWYVAPSGTAGNAITFTQAMTLDAAGALGIGYTTPSVLAALAVKDAGYNGTLALLSSTASNSIYIKNTGTSADFKYNDAYPMTWSINGTERMRLDSSGNLAINATAPKNPDAYSTTNFKFLTLQATAGGSDRGAIIELVGTGGGTTNYWLGGLRFFSTGNTYTHSSIYSWTDNGSNTGALIFSTNASANSTSPTERMRISSAGIVSITGDNGPLRVGGSGYVVNPTVTVIGQYTSTRGYIQMPGAGQLEVWNGGTGAVATFSNNGNFNCSGALSKGSGSFRIRHPLPALTETHELVHSFIEGPQADNLYRGKVTLVSGLATVNIDQAAGMTDGTFVVLNREVQCFTTNETGWTAVRGSVAGNILTIEAQDIVCADTISWMVIGERQDAHMYDTDWTDENGKVIVEPLKSTQPIPAEQGT